VNDIAAQLWRRRRTGLGVFVAVLLPALAVILMLSPVYFATGSVIIGNQEPGGPAAGFAEKLGDPADLESQILVINSRRMLRLAMTRPGAREAVLRDCQQKSFLRRLSGGGACADLLPGSQKLIDYVAPGYTVGAVGRSRIISIGYKSQEPNVAFVLANALLVTYLEDQRAENASRREEASEWILKLDAQAQGSPSVGRSENVFSRDLYDKTKELEAERRVLVNSARLVSLAEEPKLPYFPKLMPLLAAALTLAAVLAVLFALRRDATDRTVRRPQELAHLVGAPLLGVLPSLSAGPRPLARLRERLRLSARVAALLGIRRTQHTFRDQSRALYAELLLAGVGRDHKRVLVSSVDSGEGKTTVTERLARLAADDGLDVLVVDANFANAFLTKRFGLEGKAGLAEAASGEAALAEVVRPTETPGLSVLPAGLPRDGDSTRLLARAGFGEAIAAAAASFDLVLIDAPAARETPDAAILARHADAVLWCVRWGCTLQDDVAAPLESLRPKRGLLGLVVTMVDPEEIAFYERPALSRLGFGETRT